MFHKGRRLAKTASSERDGTIHVGDSAPGQSALEDLRHLPDPTQYVKKKMFSTAVCSTFSHLLASDDHSLCSWLFYSPLVAGSASTHAASLWPPHRHFLFARTRSRTRVCAHVEGTALSSVTCFG